MAFNVSTSERSLREKLGLGDWAVTLFAPLDEELFPIRYCDEQHKEYQYRYHDHHHHQHDNADKDDSSCSESSSGDTYLDDINEQDSIPVYIEPPEDLTELVFAPRILNEEMLQQIVSEGLSENLQIYTTWKRLFSINVHGDCISTMINQCKSYRFTLLVVKTSSGNILGGFASEPWMTQGSYYGRGSSFLFSDYPEKPNQQFSFYKWAGANDYCQLCDVPSGRIALGGGGNFGLVLDNNFSKGSTGPCATFNNPALVPGIGGNFDIDEFEVYGIVPLLQTMSFREQ